LTELLTIRHGPKKGRREAKVRLSVAERARSIGKHRRLAYLLAIWTGLRRSEMAALVWRDVDLDALVPVLRLRAETTKAKRADSLVIHPQLADELRALRPDNVKPNTPVLASVPGTKAWKNDLRAAGVDYGNESIGYADLHAQRKTLSTMMAAAGMSQRVRQAHMRHTDPRLTENTYMDEGLLPIAAELGKLPPIPRPHDPGRTALPMQATGTDDAAGNMQETCCPTGQNGSQECASTAAGGHPHTASQVHEKTATCAAVHPDSQKRAMGLEPTTFTLAT
jgi:hypothetical protein